MTWFGIGAAAVGGVAKGYSAHSSAKNSRKAQEAEQTRLDALEFEESEDYKEIQGVQKDLGLGLLKGDVPDYFSAIGETGSREFEDMLALKNRDISQSVSESQAKGGIIRGGQHAAATAKAVGDSSVEARYDDYQRSLGGKEYLLNTGIGLTDQVASNAYTDARNRQDFKVNKNNAANMLDYKRADTDSQATASYMGIISSLAQTVGGLGAEGKFKGLFGGGNNPAPIELGKINPRPTTNDPLKRIGTRDNPWGVN